MPGACEVPPERWPLGTVEFAALLAPLGPWPASRRVGVAVSGGADSLCLAYLAASWGAPHALIVDHGLRRESAMEAQEAARRLAGFGVPATIVRVQGLAPGPALAARARAARYTALTQAATQAGLSDLLLGHHAGDQAETVLMRRQAGSGPEGLAAMAAVAHRSALRLVRPLLSVPPARLRATLRQAGIGWAEDPSNRDPASLRARLRAGLQGQQAQMADLVREAGRAAQARAATEALRSAAMASGAAIFPEGYALLAPGAMAPDCLAALVGAIGGCIYPPPAAAALRLSAAGQGTLAGARLLPAGRLGPGRLLVREAASLGPPVPAEDGALWDNRFRLTAPAQPLQGATIEALGADAARFRHLSSLPASVLQTLPTLRLNNQIQAIPHLDYFTGWTNNRLKLTLTPPEPAAGGEWVGDAEAARCHHV